MRELDLKPGQDGLQKILDHLDQPVETQSETVQKFWKEVKPSDFSKLKNRSQGIHPRRSLFNLYPNTHLGSLIVIGTQNLSYPKDKLYSGDMRLRSFQLYCITVSQVDSLPIG